MHALKLGMNIIKNMYLRRSRHKEKVLPIVLFQFSGLNLSGNELSSTAGGISGDLVLGQELDDIPSAICSQNQTDARR